MAAKGDVDICSCTLIFLLLLLEYIKYCIHKIRIIFFKNYESTGVLFQYHDEFVINRCRITPFLTIPRAIYINYIVNLFHLLNALIVNIL